MISEELKKEMKKLRKEGISYSKISLKLLIPLQTVMYHTCDKYRENIKRKARENDKNKPRRDRKKYFREYQNKRYKEDKVFREKQKKRARRNKRNA